MASTVAYGEGWITAIAPAPSNASITAALTSIRDSPVQAQYELEPGELRCGPSGIAPAHLTALDGETLLPLSPQLVEFYSYARFWRRSVLLHNVIDPGEYLDHATDPRINLPGLLEQEFHAPSVLVDVRGRGLDPSRCALFWLDTLEYAIYNRAYFVFDPPPHSRTEGHTHGEPRASTPHADRRRGDPRDRPARGTGSCAEDAELQGGSQPLDTPYLRASPWLLWRKRIVWLLVLFVASAYTATVMQLFEDELEAVVALAFFIPLLIGTGGNTGT